MAFELEKDEKVIYEARRSWFVLFSKTVGSIFSLLIPIFVFSLIQSINPTFSKTNQDILLMIFLLSWLFLVWNFIFVVWTDYYLDILIITDKNIIDIEQKGLFVREIAIVNLKNIQDITSETTGFIASMVGYGDIKIQSAGSHREFILRNIDRPNLVRSKIKEAISDIYGKI